MLQHLQPEINWPQSDLETEDIRHLIAAAFLIEVCNVMEDVGT